INAVLGLAKGEVGQGDGSIARKIVDRREAVKEFLQSFFEKPFVRIELELNEIGDVNDARSLLGRVLDFLQWEALLSCRRNVMLPLYVRACQEVFSRIGWDFFAGREDPDCELE